MKSITVNRCEAKANSLLHNFCDVRQVHLDTVLILVRGHVHPLELAGLFEFSVHYNDKCYIY